MSKPSLFVIVTLLTTLVSYVTLRPRSYVQPLHEQADTLQAHLSISPQPPKPQRLTQVSLTVTDQHGKLAALLAHHGRLAHMMVIAEDFSSFGHLHPEDFGELCLTGEQSVALRHSLQYRFPAPGRFLAAVNVATADQALSQNFAIRVPGRFRPEESSQNTGHTQCFKGYPETSPDQYSSPVLSNEASVSCETPHAYRVELQLPQALRANESLRLGYRVSQNGQPLANLQPYLAAGLHIAVASDPIDKHGLQHIHGMPVNDAGEIITANAAPASATNLHHASADHHLPPPAAFGPRLLSEPFQFPQRGRYWLFGQFKHGNNIVFTRFPVDVEAGFSDADATVVELSLNGTELIPSTIKVEQQQNVVLRIVHDNQQGELHITGYEIEKSITAASSNENSSGYSEMRFNAELAGQFSIELHPSDQPDSDIPIGLLQVLPR